MNAQTSPASGILQPAGPRRRVVFWRHGRTSWNASRRFQGQTDIDLDDVGIRQAARAAALLAGKIAAQHGIGPHESPVRIVSSDLQRARATANALAQLTGLHVHLDPRLRETFGGVWEGLTFEQIQDSYPADIKRWQLDEADARAGGGETRLEVAERMVDAVLDAAAATPEGGTLIVATHGGASRVGIARLLGLPDTLWKTISGLSNCHWSVVEESQPSVAGPAQSHWRLTEHNVGTLPEPYEMPEDLAEPVED